MSITLIGLGSTSCIALYFGYLWAESAANLMHYLHERQPETYDRLGSPNFFPPGFIPSLRDGVSRAMFYRWLRTVDEKGLDDETRELLSYARENRFRLNIALFFQILATAAFLYYGP